MKIYLLTVALPLLMIAAIALLTTKLSRHTVFTIKACLFVIMLLSGIAKQIVAICTGYSLWYLPLHFSSTFYISVGVSVFARGKAKHVAQTALFTGGLFMFAMILVRPAAILGNLHEIFTSHIHMHGYFSHMFIMQQLAILLARNEYVAERKDPLIFTGIVAVWGLAAIPCAFALQANYMGILHAYIPFMETLRLKAGYGVYLIVYFLSVAAIATGVILLFRLWQQKLFKRQSSGALYRK